MPSCNEADVDKYVGNRLRERRVELGYSQTEIAVKLGLTFQQVQKYERGYNRVSASRLHDLTKILNVEIEYFFEDIWNQKSYASPMAWGPELKELITVFDSLPEKMRITLRLLLKSLS